MSLPADTPVSDTAWQMYETWLNDPFFDQETKAELRPLQAYPDEISERFSGYPAFGTGGMRGELGAGTRRINRYTVALATLSLADYLLKNNPAGQPRGVVIAYDTRLRGCELAEIAAACLVSRNIPVFLSDTYLPVPILSFAVRHLQADAGIMITASHNPARYNGYKVYGPDGGQITLEFADKIMNGMQSVSDLRTLHWLPAAEARKSVGWQSLDPAVDQAYLAYLKATQICPEQLPRSRLSLVYTPLHGTGGRYVGDILSRAGLKSFHLVTEQARPDPFFSTVSVPNPESPAAFRMAVEQADRLKADLAMATDPDSDRVGIVVRAADGSMQTLTGNQIGLLLMEYILRNRSDRGQLPAGSFCVTTRVSTRLAGRIARHYGVELQETLTGFKYIGERIQWFDEQADQTFCFGFEESFGYLAGTQVRDKDALQALLLISEMAAEAQMLGQNLLERLETLYQEYGYASEDTLSFDFAGIHGLKQQQQVMAALRQDFSRPGRKEIGGIPVAAWRDHLQVKAPVLHRGIPPKDYLPPADMLYWEMGGELECDWICVRPSGTEPKLKVYLGAYARTPEKARSCMDRLREGIRLQIMKSLE